MARVVLGITGSIGAYKAAEVIRLLRRRGHSVQCVMTKCAQEFIGEATCEALSQQPVITGLFDNHQDRIVHTSLADSADVVLVAPATANCIGRLAQGIADDVLSCLLLATQAPVLMAPAMNVHMWEHPAVQANVELLKQRGVRLVGPVEGELACGYAGMGHLAEPEAIVVALETVLNL